LRADRSLRHQGFEPVNGLPWLPTDGALHDLLEAHTIASAGANLLLSWPVTDVPFQLESAPSLPGTGSWLPVMQTATTNGTTVSVLVPAANSTVFFRLVQSP